MRHSSESYQNYRSTFLSKLNLTKLNVHLHSIKIDRLGINNEELFQDHCYINNNSATTVVHLSGVHGVEGYLGSLIQNEILTHFTNEDFSNINFAMVHAVNPWGMSWYRRANPHNVDLNRNALNFSQIPSATKIYEECLPFLRSQNTKKLLLGWLDIIKFSVKYGFFNVSQKIAEGQYQYEKDLFFGGHKLQPECALLIENLKNHFPNTKKWIVIDVHTGLGAKGFDSLIHEGRFPDEEAFFAQKLDKKHIINLKRQRAIFYPHGMFGNNFRLNTNGEVYYLTQEFGTLPFFQTISTLILENQSFWAGKHNDPTRIQRILDSFYLADSSWKKTCVKRGLRVLGQILW